MHLLLALTPDSHPDTAEKVNYLIRATWPDPVHEPRLFEIVKRSMVHSPCGQWKPDASCIKTASVLRDFLNSFRLKL